MSCSSALRVCFVGVGAMGRPMARRLLAANINLTVYDTSPAALTAFPPSVVSHNLLEVSKNATPTTVILSLPHCEAVNDLLQTTLIHLSPGSTVVDTSTTTPDTAKTCFKVLQKHGIRFVEAPITGEQKKAEDGALTFICAGNPDALHDVTPILQHMGTHIVFMGEEYGNGQLTKALNNTLYNISTAAMSEILTLAKQNNIPAAEFIQVVSHGTGSSFGFNKFAPLCMNEQFAAPENGYAMKNAFKDMEVTNKYKAASNMKLPVTEACEITYRAAIDMGFGNEVKGAMIKVVESQVLKNTKPADAAQQVEADVDSKTENGDGRATTVAEATAITRKDVRAWCRGKYGPGWWEVEPEVKRARMKEAKIALLEEQMH